MSQEENPVFSNGLEPPNSARVTAEDKPETMDCIYINNELIISSIQTC